MIEEGMERNLFAVLLLRLLIPFLLLHPHPSHSYPFPNYGHSTDNNYHQRQQQLQPQLRPQHLRNTNQRLPPPVQHSKGAKTTVRRGPSTLLQPCPPPYNSSMYCLNKGKCYAMHVGHRAIKLLCRCKRNFEGKRCQRLFDPVAYGFSKVGNELENRALSTLAVILLLMTIGFIWCLALHRRLVHIAALRLRRRNNETNTLMSLSAQS